MPLYTYQCSCGLQFEASAPMAEHSKPKACPICGSEASRVMPVTVTGSFNHAVEGLPVPQNTGIQQLDAHIDRVIGQSAKKGWEVIDQRYQAKKQVLDHHPEATGHDLSRNPDGSYRVLPASEKELRQRVEAVAEKVLPKIEPKKTTSN